MSFIVEDGTGLENANSYVTLAFASSYFSSRGVGVWADQTENQQQVALIKATDYIDAKYAHRFSTKLVNKNQALTLPRVYFIDAAFNKVQEIPVLWLKAVCEYALVSLTRELFTSPSTGSKEIKSELVTVGPITTRTEYLDSPSQAALNSYPAADRLVVQLLGTGSNRVVR